MKGRVELFKYLCITKNGDEWDVLARSFMKKIPIFGTVISKFLKLISEYRYKKFVTDIH